MSGSIQEESRPLVGTSSAPNYGITSEPAAPSAPPRGKQRVVSLDAVRGLTVAVMIFVDNTGEFLQGRVNHSPWDTVTFADFVMPFFLFMVGAAIPLALSKYQHGVLRKILSRTVKLFLIGLLTQGVDGFPGLGNTGLNLKTIRIPGILQRIAWAYLVLALMAVYFPKYVNGFRFGARLSDGVYNSRAAQALRAFSFNALHWMVACLFMLVYVIVMLGLTVPSYSVTIHQGHGAAPVTVTVDCDVRGDLTPKCSAARTVDYWLLGYDHLYNSGEYTRTPECSSCSPSDCPMPWPYGAAWCFARLDPEGVLSSLPVIFTAMCGYHFGSVLLHVKDHAGRLWQWLPFSTFLFVLGIVVDAAGWKMNKQLWSPSYVFMMAGATGLCLVLFYLLMDFTTWQPRWMRRKLRLGPYACHINDSLRPLVWVGMNTIFIYLMSPAAGLFDSLQSYVYWDDPTTNTLEGAFFNYAFCRSPIDDDTYPLHEAAVCQGGMFDGRRKRDAVLLWIFMQIAIWFAVAGLLHRYRWYWAL